MATIDRNEWTAKRIAFLKETLEGQLSDETRAAVEAELAELEASRPRWRRWLWPTRLPNDL